MMWLKIKKMLVRIMDACVEIFLLVPATSKSQLDVYELSKKIYDVIYCSFQSIVFLAAIKLARERYDTITLEMFYYIGYFAWTFYLFSVIKYFVSTILESYTTIDLESDLTLIIYNYLALVLSLAFGFLGPKIIVDFVNMKFPIN